jgi:hypothetical protein
MSSAQPPQPPAAIELTLDEALDLLGDLEDARDALGHSRHFTVVVAVEGQIRLLSRRLGFADPHGGDDDG